MTFHPTDYKHISLNDDQIPYISGTTMKVVELITAHLTYGWSPAELHFQYPHISLSQIYSALAYYCDHQSEIDADIERRLHIAQAQRKAVGTSSIVAKLRAQGKL